MHINGSHFGFNIDIIVNYSKLLFIFFKSQNTLA